MSMRVRLMMTMIVLAIACVFAMTGCGRTTSGWVDDVRALAEEAAAVADAVDEADMAEEAQSQDQDASAEDEDDATAEDDAASAVEEEPAAAVEKAVRHAYGEAWGSNDMQITVNETVRGPGNTKATVSKSNQDKYEIVTVRFAVSNTAKEPIFTDTRPFFSYFKVQDPEANTISMALFNAGNGPFGKPIQPGESRDCEMPFLMNKGGDPADLKFMCYPLPFANGIPSIGDATAVEGWHYVMMAE